MKNDPKNAISECEVWKKFEIIRNYHTQIALNDNTEMAYRFYEGDQWHGLEGGSEQFPVYNFIKPTVNYKVSMIAMNAMTINFSVIGKTTENDELITGTLNKLSSQYWERQQMDKKCWQIVKDAAIAGDSYIYFYDSQCNAQIIDNTNVFLGDERQLDIQKQPFIIIAERVSVDEVIKKAKKNGVSKDAIADIVSDEEVTDYVTTENNSTEIKLGSGKCTSLLYLELMKNGDLKFCRTTKYVKYQPDTVISGLGCYPVAALVFGNRKGTARGNGEVRPLINNQIEVNKNLARRILNAKMTAFSRLVYSSDRIVNPRALTEVGAAIEVEGDGVSSIKDAIDYLSPAPMSSEAVNLTAELIGTTRDLAGAGDAALGNVDPTQASGTAIIAVRDQAALPLNEQTAAFKQFVEDIARIWLSMFKVYNPDGIPADNDAVVMPSDIDAIDVAVQIDVSSKTPFSKYAREQALERLFTMGHITFDEYVLALDNDSSVPKVTLEKIINKRAMITPPAEPTDEADASNLPGTMSELENMAVNALIKYGGDINDN